MLAPPFLVEEGSVHRFRCSPRVLLHCPLLWGPGEARTPSLDWILLLFLPLGEGRGVTTLLEGWCYGLLGHVILPVGVASRLVSCSTSLIKLWLVRRSASISFVLSCIVSSATIGGRLSELPCWSCILGGLA